MSELPGRAIRVLVVDDDALVRRGLRAILSSAPDIEVVAEAADGLEALDLARTHPAQVALVDVRMPRLDGIETARRLREMVGPPAVVMLTSFNLDRYVYDAITAGACGFLLKDASEERLLSAVRSAHDGLALLDVRVTAGLARRFDTSPQHASPLLTRLTPRETTILLQLASGDGNATIGRRLHISEATVKTHVSRILTKLELQTRVQAVVLAYESGLAGRRTEPPLEGTRTHHVGHE